MLQSVAIIEKESLYYMTKMPILLILSGASFMLMACPYNSPHSLDEAPKQPIDENLLGKWATMVTVIINDKKSITEPVKVIFSKKSDMEYDLAIIGYTQYMRPFKILTNDTIYGTGFLSTIDKNQFLNTSIAGRTYISEVQRKSGAISLLPLHESFTAFKIKSSDRLRNIVSYHFKSRLNPSYDEDFALRNLQRVN